MEADSQVSDLESFKDGDSHKDGPHEEKDVAMGKKTKQVGIAMP